MADVAAAETRRYPGPIRAWSTVALLSILFIVSFIDRFVLALLIEPLKGELHLSDTQVGLLIGTVFAVVYMIIGVPLARVADVWSRRNLIVLGALVWTLTTTGSAFSTTFTSLLILRMGVAVGEAVLSPAGISMIADMFPREKRIVPSAVFIGVGSAGANLSLFLGAAVLDFASTKAAQAMPLIGGMSPWRITLILVGLPGVLLALLFILAVREPPRQEVKAERPPLSAVFKHIGENGRTYFGMFGLSILCPVNVIALMAWFPTHLIRAHGVPASEAGYQFGFVGMLAILGGAVLVPAFAAHLAKKRPDAQMVVATGAILIGTPLVVWAVLTKSALLAILLIGPGFGLLASVGGMNGASSSQLAPGRLRAVMMALFTLAQSGAGLAFGPLIVATLSQHVFPGPEGIGHGIALQLAVTAPLALILAIASRKPFAESIRQAHAREQSEVEAIAAVPVA